MLTISTNYKELTINKVKQTNYRIPAGQVRAAAEPGGRKAAFLLIRSRWAGATIQIMKLRVQAGSCLAKVAGNGKQGDKWSQEPTCTLNCSYL
jgi:hypothetical protein